MGLSEFEFIAIRLNFVLALPGQQHRVIMPHCPLSPVPHDAAVPRADVWTDDVSRDLYVATAEGLLSDVQSAIEDGMFKVPPAPKPRKKKKAEQEAEAESQRKNFYCQACRDRALGTKGWRTTAVAPVCTPQPQHL